MDKFVKSVAAFLLLLCTLSCNDIALKTGHYELNETEALAEGRTDSISISTSVEYPRSGLRRQAREKICDSIVKLCYGISSCDVEAAARQWADSCIAEYREEGNELLKYLNDNGENEPIAALSWERLLNGYIAGGHGDIISYIVSSYDFSGGAHGSSSELAINFNKKSGEIIDEDDIFAEDSGIELSELLSAHLQAVFDNETYNSLFIKNIEPNGNFFVSEEGVTYIYGQYEIGPYYLGIIKLTLPWEELEGLLK